MRALPSPTRAGEVAEAARRAERPWTARGVERALFSAAAAAAPPQEAARPAAAGGKRKR